MYFVISEVELEYNNFIGTPIEFVNAYLSETGRRITILDEDAIVLADSHDGTIGTDKSERPEIKNLGVVYKRTSDTIDISLLYIAQRLDDNNYLRVAIPVESKQASYNSVILVLVLTSAGFIAIFYLGLNQLSKNLLTPWNKVKEGLINLNQGNVQMISLNSPYPEINEIIHEINGINLATLRNLKSIESYQIQLNEILNELKQGVMLFNKEEQLVYFNDDAKSLFNISEDAYLKPSYYAIRDTQIRDAITKANLEHQSSTFDSKMDGKTMEVRVFFVNAQGFNHTEATVLALFKDVSQERAIEQMKRDFFSHASHELKSPLTAIRGYAELIEHGLIKGDEIKDSSHQIVKQTETMAALVEDMLMLSRLENLKEKIYSKQDLHQILNEVLDTQSPFAISKNINLSTKSKSIKVMCDPLDIHKLFKNLIENAIKYSDPNKKVEITLDQIDKEVIFIVKDQGFGIEPEHQQRVFERFFRVDKGRLDGGTGLGLAIVKHIALKYNGTVELTSTLSKGTRITVKLKMD
ncbi:MAG: HAMP domain-containing sensor histidine kinase [Acholeplasmataceae bacterium]|nr:HAMP domain-containing sensor histidine kinase [Acholeplasmataceae bacterium]